MPLPFVIDNRMVRLDGVLNDILGRHQGRSVDVATAYFSIRGFERVREGLDGLGSFRLILGANPQSGENIGIHLDPRASQLRLQDAGLSGGVPDAEILRQELARAPLTEGTQRLIEAARRARAAKLLFLGSSCIYPKFAPQPIREDALLTGAARPAGRTVAPGAAGEAGPAAHRGEAHRRTSRRRRRRDRHRSHAGARRVDQPADRGGPASVPRRGAPRSRDTRPRRRPTHLDAILT